MLKYVLYSVIVLAVLAGAVGGYHLYRVSVMNAEEMAEYSSGEETVNKNFGKALVVYYSLSGRTRDIAERIRAKTQIFMRLKLSKKSKVVPRFTLKAEVT